MIHMINISDVYCENRKRLSIDFAEGIIHCDNFFPFLICWLNINIRISNSLHFESFF
jgi:hypothetical protein